jgi:hypothetical protein
LVLFGAATHDIGKTKFLNELEGPGNEHLHEGRQILLNLGYSKEESRFAYTHSNWNNDDITVEDLIVSLSDNLWCGSRINELEELAVKKIADILKIDFWEVYRKLNPILDKIASNADKLLEYQGK